MRAFTYHRPTTLAEAATLLAELGDEDVALLAGGTSLMNLAKLGLAEPEHVIALAELAELSGLSGSAAEGLSIGAMTSLRELEMSSVVAGLAPGLVETAAHVATVRIRNQATIGGNLVHADPNQDLPPMLMVHDATVRLTGPGGAREVAVSDMFVGFLESVVAPDEILTGVRVPVLPPGTRTGYLKFLPRTQDDYPTVSVAAAVTVVDGRIQRARVAVAGGGVTTLRCHEAESALVDGEADARTFAAAAAAVPDALDPISDGRGSARYKRQMAGVCTQRLLQRLVPEATA